MLASSCPGSRLRLLQWHLRLVQLQAELFPGRQAPVQYAHAAQPTSSLSSLLAVLPCSLNVHFAMVEDYCIEDDAF